MRNAVPSLSASLLRTTVLLCFLVFLVPGALATSYYFSSSASCPGSGTSGAPYCALTSANSIDFNPGDQMLLARGSLWTGQQLVFADSDDGSSVSWITVDAYGTGARPILDWTKLSGQKLIVGTNVDYMVLKNFEVREAQIGIDFSYTTLGHNGLKFENIYFHDMFYDASDGSIYDGSAMYVSASGSPPSGTNFYIKDVTFDGLEAKNSAYAPGFSYGDPGCPSDECDTGDPIQNVVIKNNYFHDVEGATSVQDIATLTMIDNQFTNLATVHQNQGTTNLFFWHTSNATLANSVLDRVPDTSSADQSHIDFEGFVNDTRIRHNYFTDAAGNAIELMAWRGAGSYLTNITIDGNVFNRNAWDPGPGQYTGAVAIIAGCVFAPGPGTISNSLYYEPTGLFNTNGCSHSFTLSANTDAGSSASFAVSGKDFSSVQGTGNWRYRYSNDSGSTWTDLGYYDSSWDNQLNDRWLINSGTAYPWVTRFRMHPDATTSHVVARQWAAPSAGTVNIRSRVLKAELGGDGVHARITKNGANLWPASGWQLVGASDQVGVAANLSSVSVASGDLIRFEIKNNANYTLDWTSWLPMITFVASGGGGDTSFVTGRTLGGSLRNDVSTTVGMRVAVGASPVTVTQLGRFFVSGNSGTHTLKIVRKSDGVEVGSVSINMATGTADGLGFKYATLGSPVTLAASTTYYVVSTETAGGDQWYDNVGTTVTTTSVASVPGSVYCCWTENGSAGESYVPMNFKYSTGAPPPETSLVASHTLGGSLRNDATSDGVGMRVAVGASAITATQIGRYFVSGNSGTHTLKIVRKSDGVTVGSVSINMGTGTADSLGFKYATLASPVTLSASTTYYVVSTETAGGDQWYDNVGTNQTPTGVATLPGSVYWNGTGWTENGDANNDSYGPMNIKYQ